MKKWSIALGAGGTAAMVILAICAAPVLFFLGFAAGPTSPAGSVCLIGGSGTSGGWTNPLEGIVTSRFGPRILNGVPGYHDGLDIDGGEEGVPFYSASSGIVTAAYGTGGVEGDGDGGHGIVVDAGDGVEIWYKHAVAGTTKVRDGDKVRPGQELAAMGDTGNSFGAHLHFKININGTAVDPDPFMKARGVTLGTGIPQPGIEPDPGIGAPALTASASSPVFTRADGVEVVFAQTQLGNLRSVIAAGQSAGMSEKGIVIALVTVLQESNGFNYANSTVPESLNLPHDKVGSDHDSVGLFQQRPASGWGTVADLMNPEISALKFWGIRPEGGGPWPRGLQQIGLWEQMSVNDAAQTVQISAVPDAYGKWEPVARQLLTSAGGASTPACIPGGEFGAGKPLPGAEDARQTQSAIVEAAQSGLGGRYRAGGRDFKDWDAQGFVHWAVTKAGVDGFPTAEQWSVGIKTSNPQPGDLVVQSPDGQGGWKHIGIYAGDDMMYSALNVQAGTVEHPVDWGTGTEYFTLVDTN